MPALHRGVLFAELFLVTAGCSTDPALQPTTPLSKEKQEILVFWAAIDEATSLRMAGLFEDAALKYEEALELAPSTEDSRYYLGHCLQETGRLSEATVAFRHLIEFNPDSSRAHMALGSLLVANGKTDLTAMARRPGRC